MDAGFRQLVIVILFCVTTFYVAAILGSAGFLFLFMKLSFLAFNRELVVLLVGIPGGILGGLWLLALRFVRSDMHR
jgi:hypothetical protein